MKANDVILSAMAGKISWMDVEEILDVTDRTVRRMRERMKKYGIQGLFDRRKKLPSPKRADAAEVQKVLDLWKEYQDGTSDFSVRHLHEILRDKHGVDFSYTFVKDILQGAGYVKKGRARGKHRRRRERRPCFGELLHLDGSRHHWLALRPDEGLALIVVLDDATGRLLYAQLWPAESTEAVMVALREVFGRYGLPQSLYTDRARWAAWTPVAGGKVDRSRLTQVGRALDRLGVEHILSYSPQARGRSGAPTRPCSSGWSPSCGSPGSRRWTRPTATCGSTSRQPSTRRSAESRRIHPTASLPPGTWTSTSSSATRRSG